MKLNFEEQEFVHRWARHYYTALIAARHFHENAHMPCAPNNSPEAITEEFEKYITLYGNYRYRYGIMQGILNAMSYKIRLELYESCLKALDHLHNEAYGE